MAGPVDPGTFDLVTARAVLHHVTDVDAAMRNLVASLAPGGAILLIEPDFLPVSVAEPAEVRASGTAGSTWSREQGIDYYVGRTLARRLAALGIEDIAGTAETAVYQGGSPWATYWVDTVDELRDRLVDSGGSTTTSSTTSWPSAPTRPGGRRPSRSPPSTAGRRGADGGLVWDGDVAQRRPAAATWPGRAGPSSPASGRTRSRARAGCAGSTSTATVRAISAGHGGEQRAVFVYQLDSYRYWERELGRDDFVYGQFGENFTVDGLADDEVCIGDRYRIGGAVFEVTQPRVTCYRVGIRMDDPRMPALLVSHRRPGFYLRVLEEGDVEAGDEIVKVAVGAGGDDRRRGRRAALPPGRTRASSCCARCGSPRSAPAGRPRSGRCSTADAGSGNAGLAVTSPPPAWPGFRPLTVTAIAPRERLGRSPSASRTPTAIRCPPRARAST